MLLVIVYSWVHAWLYPPLGLPPQAAWGYFQHPDQRSLAPSDKKVGYNDTFNPDDLGMTDETCTALFPRFGYEADRSVRFYRDHRKVYVLYTLSLSACG